MIGETLEKLVEQVLHGKADSDRHVMALFAIALASKGKRFIELGVGDGTTTLPLLMAANLNGGKLTSVDINNTDFICPEGLNDNWEFVNSDALSFLGSLDYENKADVIYIDDWHSYAHVKKELEFVDRLVGPSSVVLMHDLMWGNHDPFYHCDLTLMTGQWAEGGPYRAVSELAPQFWEWSTLPWANGLTILRKKYSSKYHAK